MIQKDLVELLYVTDKTVSRWETSVYMPDLSLLTQLTKKLEISVYELLTGEENKSRKY